jgi:hypothetical protein
MFLLLSQVLLWLVITVIIYQAATESNPQSVSYLAWGFSAVCHHRAGVLLSQRHTGEQRHGAFSHSPQACGSKHIAVNRCCFKPRDSRTGNLIVAALTDFTDFQYSLRQHCTGSTP